MRARPIALPTSERHRSAALRAKLWAEPALAARYARDPAGVLSEFGVPAPAGGAAELPQPPDDALTVQSLVQVPSSAFTVCFTATLCYVPPPRRRGQRIVVDDGRTG